MAARRRPHSLPIALPLDTFAWVGGFPSAPNTQPVRSLITDASVANQKLRLLWVSCGDVDGLMSVSKPFHEGLVELRVKHIWHVDAGGHAWPVWRSDLYLIAQLLFKDKEDQSASPTAGVGDLSRAGGPIPCLQSAGEPPRGESRLVLLHDKRYDEDHGCHGDENNAVRSHDTPLLRHMTRKSR